MTWTIGRCPPVDIRASHHLRDAFGAVNLPEPLKFNLDNCSFVHPYALLVGVLVAGHETVSRKHAQASCPCIARGFAVWIQLPAFSEVNRQGCFTFIQDLGSAHGTVLNGHKLLACVQNL